MDQNFFHQSDEFYTKLKKLIDKPLSNQSKRVYTSDIACSLAIEHWMATMSLLRSGFLPSAVTVHRAQFEALLRSIWLLYVANDLQIEKLATNLNSKTEQAAKNLPQVADMVSAIGKKGPPQVHEALLRFKDNSWQGLNSYAHAGIHSLHRHSEGYPDRLIIDIAKNANGLLVISTMQSAVLCGIQTIQRDILGLANKYKTCMPPPI